MSTPPVDVVDQAADHAAEAKPAAWMYVTASATTLHFFPAKRGRSACGRYFRNAEFTECGLWWPEAGQTPDDCWTCRNRLDAALARRGTA